MSKLKNDTAEPWQASQPAPADMNDEGHYGELRGESEKP